MEQEAEGGSGVEGASKVEDQREVRLRKMCAQWHCKDYD